MLTPRDLALLEWIARHNHVTQDQVQRWIAELHGGARSPTVAYTRLKVLATAQLVFTRPVVAGLGRACWATRAGAAAVGAVGSVRPPKVSTFEHDCLVVDLALHVQITRPEHVLVTEREMRAADTANQHTPIDAVPRYAVGFGRQRRYPDLVSIAPSGARVVHEVERTAKDHRRLVTLMLQRVEQPGVAAVRYYGTPASMGRLERAAHEAELVAGDARARLSLHRVGVWQ